MKKEKVVETQQEVTYDLSDLTGKNSDYIHAVTRQLLLAGSTDAEVKSVLSEIVPRILEGQKDGITARNLLGSTPTELVAAHAPASSTTKGKKPRYDENENPWLMWLDSTLLIFSIFSAVNGVSFAFSKTQQGYPLAALLVAALGGGALMLLWYRNFLSKLKPGERPRYGWKSMGLMILALLAWFGLTSAAILIPTVINPQINGIYLIVIAVVVFGIRFLVKRQFHIKSIAYMIFGSPVKR